jgi:hypothetical protein
LSRVGRDVFTDPPHLAASIRQSDEQTEQKNNVELSDSLDIFDRPSDNENNNADSIRSRSMGSDSLDGRHSEPDTGMGPPTSPPTMVKEEVSTDSDTLSSNFIYAGELYRLPRGSGSHILLSASTFITKTEEARKSAKCQVNYLEKRLTESDFLCI